MRLAVYTDYEYRVEGDRRYGQRAFVVFLEELGRHVDRLVLVGRVDPQSGSSHYPLRDDTELVGLPHYESLAHLGAVIRSLAISLGRFWRLLGEVDTVWVLGPYPHAAALAMLAIARRRRLVLGVRQDMPTYVRVRRPETRWMHIGADVLEAMWKLLARRYAVVVVGPELARQYRHARSLLEIAVSLVRESDLVDPADLPQRQADRQMTVLTVGRIAAEKNPLLLPEILRRLNSKERRWRMVVCGEGPLSEQLRARFAQLGLLDCVEVRGYVPFHAGLLDLYRDSDAFLHVSLTEGFPQVLVEAQANCLPAVATAVGGVPAATGGAALLIEPGDAEAAAEALERIVADERVRATLIENGARRARESTLEAVSSRLAQFLAAAR